ncbi:MAG: hypothetical protein MK060_09140 [Blastomonas sp.]|uniref:hypothetical protein n=1 Tax=unclassified Blastomonas TaxID=2626550 RepID=UPI0008359F4C|nr:hypothetical protein [Blastomonas sp.]MCH2238030.1 hypothetical protein [Blastomonas sp.]OHD02592.1 MAG: hypothetical protein A2885_11205 [Sphingopyxis sp. RIFCSPHIGHO2_01_FULL_65_24]
MIKFVTTSIAFLGFAAAATAAVPMLQEEQVARAEEARIITLPIAGIENRLWFDYRINVTEAQKELGSDLRRATDIEDRRDAWEEYAVELKHERVHYIEEMAERGYRMGNAIIVD